MKHFLAAIAISFLILTLTPPSQCTQKSSVTTRPVGVTAPPPAMDAVLADLERVSAATNNDIIELKRKRQSSSWRTAWMFWRRRSTRNPQADHISVSLQRNLRDAMPGLIHDAEATGAFTSNFKLYNNLSVLCELLDSLVTATKSEGQNNPIVSDSAAMGRIRQQLAAQILVSAAALDSRGKAPYTWFAASRSGNGNKLRGIAADNAVPQRKSTTKKTSAKPVADPQ